MRRCCIEVSSPWLGASACALLTHMRTTWFRAICPAAKAGVSVSIVNPHTVAARVNLAIIFVSLMGGGRARPPSLAANDRAKLKIEAIHAFG